VSTVGEVRHAAHGDWGMDMHLVTVGKNSIYIGACDVCHHVVAQCNHDKNSWNEDGTTLTCDFCGIDGT
jgi:hypothetical protein